MDLSPYPGKMCVIQVFRDQHLRKQARRRDPLVDDVRRHRRLQQPLAGTADPLAADVSLDLEHAGGVVELLAYVLADALQAAAAVALSCFGLVAYFSARERGRQSYATRLVLAGEAVFP